MRVPGAWPSLAVLSLATAPLAAVPLPPLPPQAESAAPASSRRQAPLREVLELADKKSPDLKSARAQAAQVVAQTRRVFTAIFPEIAFNAQYVHTTAKQEFDSTGLFKGVGEVYNGMSLAMGRPPVLPTLPDDFAVDPVTIVDRNSIYATLQLTQLLFTPAMFAIPAATDGRAAAELGAEEAREQILLNIARLYLGAQGLDGLISAAREAEQVLQRREKDARARMEVGTGTAIDLLRAQADRAAGRNQLTMLESQRENLHALLEALVGEPLRPTEGAVEALELGGPAPERDEPWQRTFVVRANKRGVETQESVLTASQLGWLPTLSAIAKGGYNSNQGFAGTNFTGDIIVALSWQLYDRGSRYITLHEDEAKLLDARAKAEAAEARARATWLSAHTNLKAAQAQLELSEAQLEVATRAQRELDNVMKAGLTTALEVSDIDNKRFFAASAAAQARSQVQVRKVELAAAEGRLAKAFGLPVKPITQ